MELHLFCLFISERYIDINKILFYTQIKMIVLYEACVCCWFVHCSHFLFLTLFQFPLSHVVVMKYLPMGLVSFVHFNLHE